MRRLLAVSLSVLALAGCVGPPQAPEAPPPPVIKPTPRPTQPPPAPLASDWNDWPFTPGEWSYRRDERRSVASFGATGGFTFACDPAGRRVILGGLANALITIRTTSMTRTITTSTPDRVSMGTIAELSATDPLLDAIAFSRGRFVIEQVGRPPLVVPPHAEIGRVIEDCRG